jgi:hypothetical protein
MSFTITWVIVIFSISYTTLRKKVVESTTKGWISRVEKIVMIGPVHGVSESCGRDKWYELKTEVCIYRNVTMKSLIQLSYTNKNVLNELK